MRSQKNAVCELLLLALSNHGVEYELNGVTPIKEYLTPDIKKWVRSEVTQGFYEGTIQMTPEAQTKYFGNEKEMSKYVSGLVNNWIKRCKEFNGGVKYVPTTTRGGQSDDKVRAMRDLKKLHTDPEVLKEIDKAIEIRLAEIKPTIEINAELLPANLRYLV